MQLTRIAQHYFADEAILGDLDMCIADTAAAPLEPNADDVERQYGDYAELYAEARAKAAAKLGRHAAALEWARVEDQIEEQDDD